MHPSSFIFPTWKDNERHDMTDIHFASEEQKHRLKQIAAEIGPVCLPNALGRDSVHRGRDASHQHSDSGEVVRDGPFVLRLWHGSRNFYRSVSACFNKLFEHVLTCLKMLACKEVTVGFHMFETVYNRSLDVRSLEKKHPSHSLSFSLYSTKP